MREPSFWSEQIQDVPVIKNLVENYAKIKEEVLSFINESSSLIDYPKWDKAGGISDLYTNYWKVCPISSFGHEYTAQYLTEEQKKLSSMLIENAKEKCPTIEKCIKDLESTQDLASAFISRLIPGSVIHPHHGYTMDWMRIHLGLVCDPECRITVGSETRTWEEGKILAFKDGGPYLHSVRHNGSKERVILSVDIKLSYLEPYMKNR